eukprot:TRINITY_DN7473_c0_g1_i1.p1 TRINITY_DN7473_c0_g1~~TRINITY_DN7473_c0_g1_i1.p1  ORF type:complete len:279 (+),score=87.41 TRINITY_DN7473_c0_g1_i1:162-998(+)
MCIRDRYQRRVRGVHGYLEMDDPNSILEEATRTRELNLSHRGLSLTPTYAFDLKTLTRLDLSHNCLVALPEEVGSLRNLQGLWLSHNAIEELPDSIGKLSKLRSLDLQFNQLAWLPETLGRLQMLGELDLRNNPLLPKLAKRLFKKGPGRILVKELQKDMATCVRKDLLEVVAEIGQHRDPELAMAVTEMLIDEFGGETLALCKLVRNAFTLIPRNLKDADPVLVKQMFDARFEEGKGAQSLSSKKKVVCGFSWIPTGTGIIKTNQYGDEYLSRDGIW